MKSRRRKLSLQGFVNSTVDALGGADLDTGAVDPEPDELEADGGTIVPPTDEDEGGTIVPPVTSKIR